MNTKSKQKSAVVYTDNAARKKANLLKPWPKGVSGNPSGKRKGHASVTAALKRKLTRKDADVIAAKLIGQAKAGNRHAVRILIETCGEDLPPDLTVPVVEAQRVIFRIPSNGREVIPVQTD